MPLAPRKPAGSHWRSAAQSWLVFTNTRDPGRPGTGRACFHTAARASSYSTLALPRTLSLAESPPARHPSFPRPAPQSLLSIALQSHCSRWTSSNRAPSHLASRPYRAFPIRPIDPQPPLARHSDTQTFASRRRKNSHTAARQLIERPVDCDSRHQLSVTAARANTQLADPRNGSLYRAHQSLPTHT